MQSFSELSLSPQILRGVSEMGFETPSPIQAQALPVLLGEPVDFLGLAGTGTGKTAAFAIPLIAKIDARARTVQALILCPTRELAMQVAGQITSIGKYAGVKVATVYGGAPFGDQVRALRGGAQVVVGTPGRVIDHLERQTLSLADVRTLILDEADEMFSMGFKEEIDKVIAQVSEESVTWLFSATMSPEVRRVVQSSLKSPVTVQVSRVGGLADGVEQLYYRCQEFEKPEMICKLIEAADDFYGLIFCQTKALVADLTRFMLDRAYKVDCLHGDMDQTSRERTMQAFRDRKLQVLICTDVAARGLDVKDITHVVNYSLPRELESYVHRIGRTARSGKTGIVMNLVTFTHRHLLGRIEQHTRVQMKEGFVPSKREIAARKVARMLPAFNDQPYADRVLEVMTPDFREALALLPTEEIAARFIVMMMPDIFGGVDGRKTKKAAKAAAAVAPRAADPAVAAPVAVAAKPVVAKPVAAPVARPVVAAQAAPLFATAKAAAEIETEERDAAAEEFIPQIESPIEAAELIVHALADANAVVDDGTEELSEDMADDIAIANVEASVETAPRTQPVQIDSFGDEVVPKKKRSSIDEPPRASSRKVKIRDEEEIASLLEEPAAFGVVKPSAPRRLASERRAPSRPGGPVSRPTLGGGGGDSRPVRSSYGSRDSRPSFGGDRRPSSGAGDSRPSLGGGDSRPSGRYERRSASAGAPRGFERGGGFERGPAAQGSSRPQAASGTRRTRPTFNADEASVTETRTARPAAPANFAKPPKHPPGPARTEREGETGGLNRRARRAALFGRTLDESSTNQNQN